jgi:hypothetical protein
LVSFITIDPKDLEPPTKVETPKFDGKSPQTPRSNAAGGASTPSNGHAALALPPAAIGMPPLTAATLMLGVTTATLHSIVSSPINGIITSSSHSRTRSDGSSSSSSSSNSSNRRRNKEVNDDESKWEKERDDKTILDALFALETLMRPKFIRPDVVSNVSNFFLSFHEPRKTNKHRPALATHPPTRCGDRKSLAKLFHYWAN